MSEDILFSRRSIRKYIKGKEVENEKIEYIGLTKQPTASVRWFSQESAMEYINNSFRGLEIGEDKVKMKKGVGY